MMWGIRRATSTVERVVSQRRGTDRPSRLEQARDPLQAMRRLLRYLRPYRARLAGVGALVSISTVANLIGPYLVGRAVDSWTIHRDTAGMVRMVLAMLLAFLLGSSSDAVSGMLMAGISPRALQRMRQDLFDHLQRLPLRFFDMRPAGELISRLINDIDAVHQAISQNLIGMAASLLSLAGLMIAMFLLNPVLAMASLVMGPLMIGSTAWITRATRREFRQLQRNLGELSSVVEESISGIRVIRAFRGRERLIQTFRSRNQAVYESAVRANTYALLLMPLTNQLGNLFVILIAGLGGWLALRGAATVGTIVAFISYARAFVQPLRQISSIYNALQAALAGAERVFEILDLPPEPPDPPDAVSLDRVRGELCVKDLSFEYVPGVPVLRNISFHVRPGQTVAIVGPTGAGKTTLANLLLRFYEAEHGSICLDGYDIREVRRGDLRQQIGVVLQDAFLFAATVMENIRYGRPGASDEEVIRAAQLAGADVFIRQLPHGYVTVLSEQGSNLSRGQRQLLAIARVLLTDPAVLILDEATSSVDPRTELQVQQALRRLREGRTSLIIAHRLSTVRDADWILVLQDGAIVEAGTFRDLLARRGVFYRLYMSQFEGRAI